LLYSLKLKALLILLRSNVLSWSSITGTRHSRSPLFILSWFAKTCISITYEANGTRDFRHQSPTHFCNDVSRTWSIGFMVHSSFKNRDCDWIARAEVAYAPVHLYTSMSRQANPFFFIVHCLIRLGEDG